MLQIRELGGMHLASFPITMVQGGFADVLLCRWFQDGRRQNLGTAAMVTAGVWVGVLEIGCVRFDHIEKSLRSGPRVAVIPAVAKPGMLCRLRQAAYLSESKESGREAKVRLSAKDVLPQ
jgi:apolipoprotein N-acyltransferase